MENCYPDTNDFHICKLPPDSYNFRIYNYINGSRSGSLFKALVIFIIPDLLKRFNSLSGRHFTAFFGAASAGFCAFLAMLGMMIAALPATFFANFSTNPANLPGLFRAQAHQLCRGITNGSAFHIKLNAPGHHFYVIFTGAGTCAMIADGRAFQTGFNTGLVWMISSHNIDFIGSWIHSKTKPSSGLIKWPKPLVWMYSLNRSLIPLFMNEILWSNSFWLERYYM